jgi:hypothetical protein
MSTSIHAAKLRIAANQTHDELIEQRSFLRTSSLTSHPDPDPDVAAAAAAVHRAKLCGIVRPRN